MPQPTEEPLDLDDTDDELVYVHLEFQPIDTPTPFRSTRAFRPADLAELLLAGDRGEED